MEVSKQVVKIINAAHENALNDMRYAGKRLLGLTEVMLIKNNKVPCVVSPSSELTPIYPDDKFPITIYHKSSGETSYADAKKKSYGSRNYVEALIPMRMIVIGKRKLIEQHDLLKVLFNTMPVAISKVEIQELNLKSLKITVRSTDISSDAIYQREYPGAETTPPTGVYFLELRYTIGCLLDTACADTCCN